MEDKNLNEKNVMTESQRQEKILRDAAKARKRKKRIKSLVTWLVVLGLFILILNYYFNIKKEQEARMEALQNQVVTIETPVTEDVYTQTIDLSGYVVPNEILEAKFRSTGAVTGVYVEEGQTVKEGQLLASIDNTSQKIALQRVENDIQQAKLSGSVKELELLELQKVNAENNLAYTDLIANFDGVVASVGVSVNDYFEAGKAAVTIIDRSKLKATVEIDEIDMQYVYLGQEATLTFDSLPGVDVPAYVSYIPMLGKYTNQGIGVVEVELTIDNPPASLIPGFTFSGSIEVKGDVRMLIIPTAAVTTGRGGATTVEVKTADGTATRDVKVKYLGEGLCQVLSGLTVDDVVVYEQTGSAFGSMMNMIGGGK